MWFSRTALEVGRARLPARQRRPRPDASKATNRRCPRCEVALDPKEVDGVTIDVCPKCEGVWLDPGEYRAARKRAARIARERRVPSLRKRDTSTIGGFFERILDFIGENFIERPLPRERWDDPPPLRRTRRK